MPDASLVNNPVLWVSYASAFLLMLAILGPFIHQK